jgi:Lrp/AsnC family transcriptional regulator for asnA, asnC and gidA
MREQFVTSDSERDGEIDSLDRKLIHALIVDARSSFLELAKDFKVSNATIHARYKKLVRLGVIEGNHMRVNLKALGFNLTAFIGIQVVQAGQHEDVVAAVRKMPQVVEVHYTTGRYSLMAKVISKDMDDLYQFLTRKIQKLPSIASTETFMVLNSFIDREFEAVALTKK